VDNEVCGDLSYQTKVAMLAFLKELVPQLDGVVLSDYCKGIFDDDAFVKEIIRICKENHVFVAIDSKSKHIECFAGADVVKPNNLELEAAVGVQIVDDESLERAGRIYLERADVQSLIVTRGAKGISIFENGRERRDYAADETKQVFDVTGAGTQPLAP
jgi:D-beta-D-heptose 7-phosphate kinase/D-beta-D-heptose 1-phosphate adenosyltransferase